MCKQRAGHMRQGVKCKLCKISCHNDCQSKAHKTIKCQVSWVAKESELDSRLAPAGAALILHQWSIPRAGQGNYLARQALSSLTRDYSNSSTLFLLAKQ